MLRLLPLARSKRTLLAAGALMCYAAAIVLAPGDVRSQLDGGRPKEPSPLQAHADPLPAPVAPDGDAFAPRAAIDDDPPAVPPPPPLPRLVTAPNVLARPLPSTHVTAIATGTQPTAVIDSGGTARVVSVGDAVDGSTIERIDEDGVELANGRRLLLQPVPGQ